MKRYYNNYRYRDFHHMTYTTMLDRCLCETDSDFKYYGARGIGVHPSWQVDFELFVDELYAEIGSRPRGAQLDRINNDNGYVPGNLRWATSKENNNNKSNNRIVTAFGRTQTAAQWADEYGIPRQQVSNRLSRGWEPERAVSEPIKKTNMLTIQGVTLSVMQWADMTGINRTTVSNRVRAGWTDEQCVFGKGIILVGGEVRELMKSYLQTKEKA